MTRFITPCFVRVENPQERKELTEWLEGIGYELDANSADINDARTNTVAVRMIDWGFHHGNMYWLQYWVDVNSESYASHIDCGTDIPLFKALSAMNDENDREQWFYCHTGSGEDFYSEHLFHYDEVCTLCSAAEQEVYFRKATAEEIINHFKNQKS